MQGITKDRIAPLFAITFFIARFIIWPIYYYTSFPEEYIPQEAKYYCIYPLFLLSSYWLFKIYKGAMKTKIKSPNLVEGGIFNSTPFHEISQYLETQKKLKNEIVTINRRLTNPNLPHDEVFKLKSRKTIIISLQNTIKCKLDDLMRRNYRTFLQAGV